MAKNFSHEFSIKVRCCWYTQEEKGSDMLRKEREKAKATDM